MLLLLLQVDRGNLGTPRANAQESGGKCLNPGIRVSGSARVTSAADDATLDPDTMTG
jgi:hypothetical protein